MPPAVALLDVVAAVRGGKTQLRVMTSVLDTRIYPRLACQVNLTRTEGTERMQPEADVGYGKSTRATAWFAAWTLAWVASLALASFGPTLWGESTSAATWAAIVANLAVGIGWIVAFTRYLRAIDELERKITLEALAVALGAGWVVGFGYVVAEDADLVPTQVDAAAALPVFMGIAFMAAVLAGRLRYR